MDSGQSAGRIVLFKVRAYQPVEKRGRDGWRCVQEASCSTITERISIYMYSINTTCQGNTILKLEFPLF